jgi:hypothetical protein
VFLDDDIVPSATFLEAHGRAQVRAARDQVTFGYSEAVIAKPTAWERLTGEWWEEHHRRKAEPNHQWLFTDVTLGNASLPRRLIDGAGGFDETFRGRREDWELGIRLFQRGCEFGYEPAAHGLHHVDASFVTALRRRRQEGASDVQLAMKHPAVTGHLALVLLAGLVGRGSLRRVLPLLSATGRTIQDSAVGLLSRAERLQPARGLAARRLLHWHAYAEGVLEAIGSWRALLELAAPALDGSSATEIVLPLLGNAPFRLPAGAADIRLRVTYDSRTLTRVAPLAPESQWDWQLVSERIVDHLERDVAPGLLSDLTRAEKASSP